MKDTLVKRFSIGFTPFMTAVEFRRIFDEFHPYIHEIYFSPPLGPQFHTRYQTREAFEDPENEKKLWHVLADAVSRGIKINMVMNQPGIAPEDLSYAVYYVREIQELPIDSSTVMMNYGKLLKDEFEDIPLCISYNQGIDSADKVDRIDPAIFDAVVCGRSSLRNFRLFNYIKSKGFKLKIILNNGCSFTCLDCRCRNCYRPNPKLEISHDISRYGPDEIYALQTLMPWEIHEKGYLTKSGIDILKISNRPCDYEYLRSVLRSYIENLNREMEQLYKRNGNKNEYYRLWCRGNLLPPHFPNLSYDKIIKFKKEIWRTARLQHFGRKNG